MASYQLIIYVDSKLLHASSPATLGNLCLAKVVDGTMNVVFQSRGDGGQPGDPIISHRNVFSWADTYKVQGVEQFASGVMIEGSTSAREIGLGQSCTYSNGDLTVPETDRKVANDSFAIKNLQTPFTGAVLQKAGNRFQYIFVDPQVLIGGEIETFTPQNHFVVFFDRVLQTSDMFTETVSTAYNFSMASGGGNRYIRWGYANPETPHSASEVPVWSDYSDIDPFPNHMEMYTNSISTTPPSICPALSFSPRRNNVVNYMASKNISTLRGALYNASHLGYPPSCICTLEFKTSNNVAAEDKGKPVAQYIGISMPPGFRVHFTRIGAILDFEVVWKAYTPAFEIIKWTDDKSQAEHLVTQLLGALHDTYQPKKQRFDHPQETTKASHPKNLARHFNGLAMK